MISFVAMEREKMALDINLCDLIKLNDYTKKLAEEQYKLQSNVDGCFPSFEEMATGLGYAKPIPCKNCIHRPIDNSRQTLRAYYDAPTAADGSLDLTCPFLVPHNYEENRMPPDDFYCAYGEKKC